MVDQLTEKNYPTNLGSSPSHLTNLVFAVFRRALGEIDYGNIRVILPNRQQQTFGSNPSDKTVTLDIKTARTLFRSLSRGSLGFAESYMLGEWETDDLDRLFTIFLKNADHYRGGKGVFRQRILDKLFHRLRRNTRVGARKNIEAHYDLGNTFYKRWLDKNMFYSSACFDNEDWDLDQAQLHKCRLILDQLHLQSNHKLLEIGCGWGSFAKMAAESHQVDITGITLSKEQLEYARTSAGNAGLDRTCSIQLQDYRDVSGTYDRIVSIEMIEAVGREHWADYFKILHDRLTEDGIAVIQGITIAESWYEQYCRRPDFIQRYIFPGGFLPTKKIIFEYAQDAGFKVEMSRNFGQCYARTLEIWKQRFLAEWPEILQLGFDMKFKRMWEYYLSYCAAGFRHGSIDVGLYRLTKQETV